MLRRLWHAFFFLLFPLTFRMVIHECLLHYFAVQRMSLCELWLKIFPLNWLWLKRFLLKLVLCSAGLPSELCYWLVFLLVLVNDLYRCCEIGTGSLCSDVIWKLQLNCKRILAHFKQYIKGFCKLFFFFFLMITMMKYWCFGTSQWYDTLGIGIP